MQRVLVQEYTPAWAGLDDDTNTALPTECKREREREREKERERDGRWQGGRDREGRGCRELGGLGKRSRSEPRGRCSKCQSWQMISRGPLAALQ